MTDIKKVCVGDQIYNADEIVAVMPENITLEEYIARHIEDEE